MLYPQNGDRIVAVDFVTSFHHMYRVGQKNGLFSDLITLWRLVLEKRAVCQNFRNFIEKKGTKTRISVSLNILCKICSNRHNSWNYGIYDQNTWILLNLHYHTVKQLLFSHKVSPDVTGCQCLKFCDDTPSAAMLPNLFQRAFYAQNCLIASGRVGSGSGVNGILPWRWAGRWAERRREWPIVRWRRACWRRRRRSAATQRSPRGRAARPASADSRRTRSTCQRWTEYSTAVRKTPHRYANSHAIWDLTVLGLGVIGYSQYTLPVQITEMQYLV